MGEEARAIYNPGEERLRLVESMQSSLKLINAAIREIARTIYEPLSARQQVMSILSQRLLGAQISEYNPRFADEEAQTAVREVPGVELGVETGPLLGPTFAEQEAEQRAGQELVDAGFPQFEGQGKKRRGRPRKY
jgi:hypothetical protein